MLFQSVLFWALLVSYKQIEVEGGTLSNTLKNLHAGQAKDVIIVFPPVLPDVLVHPDITASTLTGDERRNEIIRMLKSKTENVQKPIVNALRTLRVLGNTKIFWAANRISVRKCTVQTLQTVQAIPGSFVVREPSLVQIPPNEVQPRVPDLNSEMDSLAVDDRAAVAYQWGVIKIRAPQLLARNINGTGIVVGIIDSGVNSKHVALITNYKNDAFSWYDSFGEYTSPHDGLGHGTHCAGTICGTTNGIGVAPGAKWIACRGLDDTGSGSEDNMLDCGQFMACPSKDYLDNCVGFPNLVSNSWGGGQGDTFFNEVVQLWRSLDIIPLFAIGNDGPNCKTAGSPGDQPDLISVGATDKTDAIAYFSSRGPSNDSFLRTKPELVAPGVDIVSADSTNITGYITHSGTSMATPHVAGAVALLLSADKTLTFDQILDSLSCSAIRKKLQTNNIVYCDSSSTKTPTQPLPNFPNNVFGYGRINVEVAHTITSA